MSLVADPITPERVTLTEAVNVVAHDIIYGMVYASLDREGQEQWGDDIGDDDWERIEERIFELIRPFEPDRQQALAAHEFLEGRASE